MMLENLLTTDKPTTQLSTKIKMFLIFFKKLPDKDAHHEHIIGHLVDRVYLDFVMRI